MPLKIHILHSQKIWEQLVMNTGKDFITTSLKSKRGTKEKLILSQEHTGAFVLIAVERAIVEKIQNDDIINNPTLIVIITIKFILYTAIKAVVRLGQAGRRSGALGTENLFSEKLFWLFKLSENINIYFTLRKSIAFSSVFVFFKS